MDKRILIGTIFAFGILLLIILEIPRKSIVGKYGKIIEDCIALCEWAKEEGVNLSPGPCLSDMYSWGHEGWVCDVAHWPRQEIDNLKENQCKNWWVEARNFVEVDPNCKPIRVYVYGEGEYILGR